MIKISNLKMIILIMIAGISVLLINSFLSSRIYAQATISEIKQTFRTYPFSDPSPIPLMNNIYPYFKFEGYTAKGVDQDWTIVTLENPYIKVLIAPQIGGKVLGAFEKSTGLPFIYFNKVVKFREIAMRGPWTSGGIEFNFGDIGHAPTTSSPVDYLIQKNGDGSVSCFIGALDLPSRTEWRVEIKLDPDKSYFETNSYWFNPTLYNTSLYNWSNAAAAVGEDLKYYFPGSNYIGHDGVSSPWPLLESGRDISYYRNNDYGEYHSYHVLGEYTDFFAGMWEKSNFGFGHWSLYSDKPGKKIWIWALSQQGQIWESLLTDPSLGNIQYTEIQSGLLFNQAGSNSSITPFKHASLAPYTDQRFSEIWFPVKGTGGVVDANQNGSLNVTIQKKTLKFAICANRPINDDLTVSSGGIKIYNKNILLKPTDVFVDSLTLRNTNGIEVVLGNNLLSYRKDEKKQLARPLLANKDFDWNSVEGICTDAAEKARQRDYSGALERYLKCLEKSPNNTQALIGAAEMYSHRMEYSKALQYVQGALANDTYDPDANFLYGVINRKLDNLYYAKDGFSIAARFLEYRSGAYTQLAEISLMKKEHMQAEMFARRALDYNKFNLDAYKILAVVYRKEESESGTAYVLDTLLRLDPLNHFAMFEKYLNDKKSESLDRFKSLIRNELPSETYLELASYYLKLKLYSDALLVLKNSPPHPIADLWIAYLYAKDSRSKESREYLERTIQSSAQLVFPFREETAEALEWAEGMRTNWKIKYYLGLVKWNRGEIDDAKKYFKECGMLPDYAPFYLTRIILNQYTDSLQTVEDFKKALQIDPKEWRTYHLLAKHYNNKALYKEALEISSRALKHFPDSYIIEFDLATSLLYNEQYEKCISILERINILPFEGAGYGHDVYRSALILWALKEYGEGRYSDVLRLTERATLWPENLGAGKPYDVDIRIEEYILAMCYKKLGKDGDVKKRLENILVYTRNHTRTYGSKLLLAALVMKEYGGDGEKILKEWLDAVPGSRAAQWSSAIFMKDGKAASSIIGHPLKQWNPLPEDAEFKLVYEVINTIK